MPHVTPIPALRDNYIWAIEGTHADSRAVALVDPGEPDAILAWLARQHARPVAILLTHHHHDHTGALPALLQAWSMPVHGPRREGITGVTHPVGEADRVQVPELGLSFEVLETPGHTRGHVCYHGHGCLFAGDTLFACGCGRLFEGSAEEMHASLRRLAALPAETELYCGHEYTLANIAFAREVEPDNPALETYHARARAHREAGLPSLPTRIAEERAVNPFLRCHEASVRMAIARHDGLPLASGSAAFARLRCWKDIF
ncbi:MAG TPA: hydroxyacylglutathione hydrolase [Thiobacillaceae bacterium]|nr:hydroxyacylglutathione hydrolase [Thiobacillaceae bacterium]HNU62960.1 hydroxyacylglutathione hydrolase [Thiobacillaceae bacterium]